MNFFKSVFSDDLESSSSDSDEPQLTNPQQPLLTNEINPKNPNFTPSSSSTNTWSFGGLIKTIASKSEVVIQNYQKGLEEFSSELKKETAVIRQAVKDLPASLEVGASVAQEKLESVGQVIDDLGNTVSEIITHGKDFVLNDNEQESSDFDNQGYGNNNSTRGYSRFDLLIRGVQTDLNTYCEELEDLDEFENWKEGFVLEEKDVEIDDLFNENGEMEGVYRKLVPKTISDEMFWSRYFYKVYKMKQVEEARANLVRRAISGEDEDLSWDVDDDEEEVSNVVVSKGETSGSSQVGKEAPDVALVGSSDVGDKVEEENVVTEVVEKEPVLQSKTGQDEVNEESSFEGKLDVSEVNDENVVEKSEDKLSSDEKNDQVESCKDSDVSVVSTQPSLPEEEDLSWDEIEDLSSIDQRKVSVSSDSPNKADLRKRLSVADDDEDLSWDIEDDD
ncbi:hypothetical protein ACHQM5_026936 [Ranunculus cassubicifolius]